MGVKVLLAGLLVAILVLVYAYQLKTQEYEVLESKVLLLEYENSNLHSSIDRQNRAIKALKTGKVVEPKAIEVIKKIEVKDEKCEAKLRAYELLFDSSF